MKPGQPQIFKNRLFENLSTRVSKSEKYKNLENPVSVWSYEMCIRDSSLGAGEILLTSMDCDGTKAGYDNELTAAVADLVSIPVIASGGAGTKEHFYDALTKGKADAVLAASLFHYKELEICDLKDYLAGRGISVRR